VVMTTAPVNQKMLLVNQKIQRLPVNLATARRVTRVTEKMILPLKHQKMTLNFDATFVKEASDVVAAEVMTTAPVNQKIQRFLVNQKIQRLPVNLVTARRVTEKMILPLKHQKTILNFDATFVKEASDVVAAVVMTTAPVNQKMLLVNQKIQRLLVNQKIQRLLMSQRIKMLLVNLAMVTIAVRVVKVAAENVEVVVILMTLLMKQKLQ